MEIINKKNLGRLYFKGAKRLVYDLGPYKICLNGDLVYDGSINTLIDKDHYIFDRYIFSLEDGTDIYENDIVLGGRCAAIVRYDNLYGARFSYTRKNEQQEYYANYADFPTITKVLGNAHQNPEVLALTKCNPQPFPEEKKVDFIDFSLPENDTLEMDYMTEHLIKQEISMFLKIGKVITQDDVDWISRRRGFNVNQKNFLIRILRMDELGKSLEFDTTHESIRR